MVSITRLIAESASARPRLPGYTTTSPPPPLARVVLFVRCSASTRCFFGQHPRLISTPAFVHSRRCRDWWPLSSCATPLWRVTSATPVRTLIVTGDPDLAAAASTVSPRPSAPGPLGPRAGQARGWLSAAAIVVDEPGALPVRCDRAAPPRRSDSGRRGRTVGGFWAAAISALSACASCPPRSRPGAPPGRQPTEAVPPVGRGRPVRRRLRSGGGGSSCSAPPGGSPRPARHYCRPRSVGGELNRPAAGRGVPHRACAGPELRVPAVV